jgi:hypothetical protein
VRKRGQGGSWVFKARFGTKALKYLPFYHAPMIRIRNRELSVHTVRFFPIGNADSCLIELGNERRAMFDFADRVEAAECP